MEKRLLGGQEILFYAMNAAWPMHFIMVAEIDGNTSRKDWHRAVKDLQDAHPMLRMSIAVEKDNLVFSESDTPLRLDISELNEQFSLANDVEQELEVGFRSDQGPLARIRLLHSDEKCVIIISAHHSIADAFSLVNLIEDLLALLGGRNIKSLPLRPSVDELLGFQ